MRRKTLGGEVHFPPAGDPVRDSQGVTADRSLRRESPPDLILLGAADLVRSKPLQPFTNLAQVGQVLFGCVIVPREDDERELECLRLVRVVQAGVGEEDSRAPEG
jgi:hypothetical protein